MSLLFDDFDQRLGPLVAAGWVILDVHRYDPTRISGLTPTGKTFTIDMTGSTVTFTIAGNTRTRTVPKATWEPAAGCVDAWTAGYAAFPAGQR